MNKRQLIRSAGALTCLVLTGGAASAQDFPPRKPVTLVVGFAAGGAADGAARIIAKKLGENIGQTVVVDNKGGAGGNIAHQFTAKGPADGSLLLLGSIGPLTIAPHLMKVGYEPFKDLAPVSGGVNFPNVLVVHKGVGVKTLAEFVALARKPGARVEFASTGAGSASHLAGEMFNQQAQIDMVHVPYKGGAPALQDLLGERISAYFAAPPTAMPHVEAGSASHLAGEMFNQQAQIDMVHVPYKGGAPALQDLLGERISAYFAAPPTAMPHVEAGKLVPLATTGLKRPSYLPNIPTVAESGYPGFEALNWYAFVAPGKTPAPILDRWNTEIVKVLNDAEVKKALEAHGLTPQPTTRAELTDFMKKEDVKWSAIVKQRHIQAN